MWRKSKMRKIQIKKARQWVGGSDDVEEEQDEEDTDKGGKTMGRRK
jgi:hypothetical protein